MRRSTADTGHSWAGGEHIPRYIHQPGYIAGLIYGPREPRYNGFPLYIEFRILETKTCMGCNREENQKRNYKD